jgi:hypothetical protein
MSKLSELFNGPKASYSKIGAAQQAYANQIAGTEFADSPDASTKFQEFLKTTTDTDLMNKRNWAYEQAREKNNLNYVNWWVGQALTPFREFWSASPETAKTAPAPQAQAVAQQQKTDDTISSKRMEQGTQLSEEPTNVASLMEAVQRAGGPTRNISQIAAAAPVLGTRQEQTQAYLPEAPPILASVLDTQNSQEDLRKKLSSFTDIGQALKGNQAAASNLGSALMTRGLGGLV